SCGRIVVATPVASPPRAPVILPSPPLLPAETDPFHARPALAQERSSLCRAEKLGDCAPPHWLRSLYQSRRPRPAQCRLQRPPPPRDRTALWASAHHRSLETEPHRGS